jgi:PIN domain nuclease of toxin-antitoxin system
MKLLLDTHIVLWAMLDTARLSPQVSAAIIDADNEVYVSAVTAFEVAVKTSLGKLHLPGPPETWLPDACAQTGFDWIVITPDDALRVANLPWHHQDPFDRLLIAQAAAGYTLVTHDRKLAAYPGVAFLWA